MGRPKKKDVSSQAKTETTKAEKTAKRVLPTTSEPEYGTSAGTNVGPVGAIAGGTLYRQYADLQLAGRDTDEKSAAIPDVFYDKMHTFPVGGTSQSDLCGLEHGAGTELQEPLAPAGKHKNNTDRANSGTPRKVSYELEPNEILLDHLHVIEVHRLLSVPEFRDYTQTDREAARILRSYKSAGLLHETWRDSKSVFQLTDKGRQILDDNMPSE